MSVDQQGEVYIRRIEQLPEGLAPSAEKDETGAYIISHSEKGHHHVIGGDVEVMERRDDVPEGMLILYAIVKEPTALRQTAANAHGKQVLEPGCYEFRISRQFDPFTQQAKRVAD